jgi:hypothetical protein
MGVGATAEQVLRARDANHHMNNPINGGFGPAKLDRAIGVDLNDPDFFLAEVGAIYAIRGREQQLIDFHKGAQAWGGTSGNAINGIAYKNPKRDFYLTASTVAFGKLRNNAPTPQQQVTWANPWGLEPETTW